MEFFAIIIVMLLVCGYALLAVESVLLMLGLARRIRAFRSIATAGPVLSIGFVLVGLIFGTRSELTVLAILSGVFFVLAPPFRLVLLMREEAKLDDHCDIRVLYSFALALMSFPGVIALMLLVFGMGEYFRWMLSFAI